MRRFMLITLVHLVLCCPDNFVRALRMLYVDVQPLIIHLSRSVCFIKVGLPLPETPLSLYSFLSTHSTSWLLFSIEMWPRSRAVPAPSRSVSAAWRTSHP